MSPTIHMNVIPTPADRMAWAICRAVQPDRDDDGPRPCQVPCATCKAGAAATALALLSELGTRTKGGAIILSGATVLAIATELEGSNV